MDRQHALNISLDDAVNRAEMEEVKKLIKDGADIEFRDAFGRTPLMNAAWVASVEIVELLISQGADINAKDNDNKTALDIVKEIGYNDYGHNDVINILTKNM